MPREPFRLQPAPARRPAAPPEPTGELLATFPRMRDGVEQELRVYLDEYRGHPYLSIRVWELGRGGYWPLAGKGVSIRLAEAQGVAEALLEALALVGGSGLRRPPRATAAGPGEGF